eukprot:7198429-Ditylum_brightwellii.AAC.1
MVDAECTHRVVECMDDLVDICHAGDVVKINVMVHVVNSAVVVRQAAGDGNDKIYDEYDHGDGSGID